MGEIIAIFRRFICNLLGAVTRPEIADATVRCVGCKQRKNGPTSEKSPQLLVLQLRIFIYKRTAYSKEISIFQHWCCMAEKLSKLLLSPYRSAMYSTPSCDVTRVFGNVRRVLGQLRRFFNQNDLITNKSIEIAKKNSAKLFSMQFHTKNKFRVWDPCHIL